MFCHEGPWHKVDRTWTIRTDGSGLTQIHHRTMNMEIEGHEFFSRDGRQIWYDLQTPRSEVFWLAGYELATRRRTWYHLERSEWSVHFNQSPDGKLFAGDGGGPSSVAAPGNGQWIYLFRPQLVPDRTDGALPESADLIQPGVLKAEKLVNLAQHDYSLEPNVTFTPDMKWIVFRSNMLGPTHVFAVEVDKAKWRQRAARARPRIARGAPTPSAISTLERLRDSTSRAPLACLPSATLVVAFRAAPRNGQRPVLEGELRVSLEPTRASCSIGKVSIAAIRAAEKCAGAEASSDPNRRRRSSRCGINCTSWSGPVPGAYACIHSTAGSGSGCLGSGWTGAERWSSWSRRRSSRGTVAVSACSGPGRADTARVDHLSRGRFGI